MKKEYEYDEETDTIDSEYYPKELDEEALNQLYSEMKVLPQKRVNTQDALRTDLMSFLSVQMDDVNEEKNLLDVIRKEILQKVVLHEYTPEMLVVLYKTMAEASRNKVTAITDIFRPTQNAGNAIMLPPSPDRKEVTELTQEQKQNLDKVSALLDALMARQNNN